MSAVPVSAVASRCRRQPVPFPRTEYPDDTEAHPARTEYLDPARTQPARMLWAARDASSTWTDVLARRDWQALDEVLFNLAVFDKAHEMNIARWPNRGSQTQDQWTTETNRYVFDALYAAALAVQTVDRDHAKRLSRRNAYVFCRHALDLCSNIVFDSCYRISPFFDVDPDSGDVVSKPVAGDRVGRKCGRFDPLVLHADYLAKPREIIAVYVFKEDNRRWVFADPKVSGAEEAADTSDSGHSKSSSGSSGSSGASGASGASG